jgi:hypothetical protein
MIRIGIFLLVLCGVFGYMGFQERGLTRKSSAAPEEITLKALIARGTKGNPNIILTDFVGCPNIVFESRTGQINEHWTKVWVPVLPLEGGAAMVENAPNLIANFDAIILSTHAGNETELAQRIGVPKLRGMVINEIRSLGKEEQRLLKQQYPNTDLSRCLIIEEGREPSGSGKLAAMFVGSGLSGLAGAVLIVLGIIWKKW